MGDFHLSIYLSSRGKCRYGQITLPEFYARYSRVAYVSSRNVTFVSRRSTKKIHNNSCTASPMPKAPGIKYTTPELRALIYQKAQEGIKTSEIASFTNLTQRTIQKIIKRYEERGDHENAPKSGRPLLLNERSIRHLSLHVEQNRRESLREVTSFVNNFSASHISEDTVRRVLRHELGMHARISAPKPFLKAVHKERRLAWAKAYQGWGKEDWKCVIWTDESSVEIGKSSRMEWVWRRPGERLLEQCLKPTFKSGRQSLMVWGSFAHGRLGPLVRMPKDERKGSDYVRLILSGPLWDFYSSLVEERGIAAVVEDGAPVHTCKAARNWRSTQQMEVFPHPAQSPDLNPIENIWYVLKTAVNRRPVMPKNVDEMWVALQQEWAKIDIDLLNNLAEGMPNRVCAVLEAKGGHTKY
jgi:transposase